MSNTADVVDGEASESDSEVEMGRSPDSESSPKAFVVAGEAPESDDESKISWRSPLATTSPEPVLLTTPRHSSSNMYNSLLHQKLWEANVSFRASLEGLARHTTDISVEKLTRSDRTLLSVQESMRAINANLTLARARIKQLRERIEKANCSSALPTIKLK